MDRKIRSKAGQAIDALRKIIAEPMFGQIKAIRGLDRFLLWGTERSRSAAAFLYLSERTVFVPSAASCCSIAKGIFSYQQAEILERSQQHKIYHLGRYQP
jgi:hypothetical protein